MRIILADSHKDVCAGMRVLLGQETEIRIVGETRDATSLVEQVRGKKPDAVLLDWELPGDKTCDMIPLLRKLCPGVKIIAMSSRPEALQAAADAGADAFVSKGSHPEKLLDAIYGIE